MVICGGIALFSVGMIYYKYTSDKENGFATNKPYKEYYTVYRSVSNHISCIIDKLCNLLGLMIQEFRNWDRSGTRMELHPWPLLNLIETIEIVFV